MINKSVFHISKMDCSAEEQLIRMKLEGVPGITSLNFDLPNRTLTAYHREHVKPILTALERLNLNTTLASTEQSEISDEPEGRDRERSALWTVLIINVAFFAIEIISGFIAGSMGLIADSLDMLADGVVYGLALFVVGGTVARKKNIAKIAGYFQIVLALIGFTEVVRRFVGIEDMPDYQTMIIISFFALLANVVCLFLLQKGKSKEAHMQASVIFTSNDVIINAGVILAGFLVNSLDSRYPDLLIGAIVFIIVARGAYRILQLAK